MLPNIVGKFLIENCSLLRFNGLNNLAAYFTEEFAFMCAGSKK